MSRGPPAHGMIPTRATAGDNQAGGGDDAGRTARRDDAPDLPGDGKTAGVSDRSERGIWAAHVRKPHRVRTCELSAMKKGRWRMMTHDFGVA